MATVEMDHVWRSFGPFPAVADLSLTVQDGEFVVLLGPSGCGKTTSLRMLAGLEYPTAGEIRLDGRVVNNLPPGRRDVALVFQSYALYPHMTVYRNLTFGPRVRHEDRVLTHQAVMEVAAVLQLDKLLERRPNELSGGQRQRVALGRALVRHPKLFLMDEPLSNLDAALRGELRAELVRLHRKLGITTVYVTHDQIEALTMADRIAIMYEGRLQQVGAGQEVFDDPANQFVAGFLGAPRMNFIAGNLIEQDGQLALTFCDVAVPLPAGTRLRQSVALPMPVNVGIRPTDLTPAPQALGDPVLNGCVDFIEPMGAETFLTARCGDVKLIARVSGRTRHAVGESVSLRIDPAFLYAFATDTGSALIDRTSIFRHRVLV